MLFELLHPADQLVLMMERIYKYGMTTTSGGNLSIHDDNGDIWITPAGIDKGALTRGDIVQVRPDGTVIGRHKPSSELPFHRQVYQSRPDIRAVVHAHPPSLVAFSAVRRLPDLTLIPNASDVCGTIRMAEYDLPGSLKLGRKIAKVFEQGGNAVLLENHGAVVGAEDLFKAFMIFETLDFCARLELNARRLGRPRGLKEGGRCERQAQPPEEFTPAECSSEERDCRHEICALLRRAYDQGLVSSTQGSFSRRMSDNGFIITPEGLDRKYIEPADLVKICGGKREAGKWPDASMRLHQAIYERHPEIRAVITAQPPAAMAFAVTDAIFDSRVIPESYILLRDVAKIPCGSLIPDKAAEVFGSKTPVAIAENACVITTGSDLLNAFDRLEVLDYTARALISVGGLGEMVRITSSEIEEIEAAFNLK